jgi:hypothetical protein
VEADGEYSYTFPAEFISETFDETRMRAIVLLIDGSTGEVVNCLGAKFDESQTSSTHAPNAGSTEAKLFPNPASQTTTLQFMSPSAQIASMNIIDALGRVADAKPLSLHQGTNRIPLDASQLDPGTYLVQLLVEGKIECSKRLLVTAN